MCHTLLLAPFFSCNRSSDSKDDPPPRLVPSNSGERLSGRAVKKDPIIRTAQKVWAVFGVALVALLITLTALTATGHLDLNLYALSGSVLICGGLQTTYIYLLISRCCEENKRRAKIQHPDENPTVVAKTGESLLILEDERDTQDNLGARKSQDGQV